VAAIDDRTDRERAGPLVSAVGQSAGAVWVETGQEQAVAALVRVRHRCSRNVPSALAQFELGRLRGQLGLEDS
jgi:hypothetical protein